MNKAFTKETDSDADDDGADGAMPPLPVGGKNHITPAGYAPVSYTHLTLPTTPYV